MKINRVKERYLELIQAYSTALPYASEVVRETLKANTPDLDKLSLIRRIAHLEDRLVLINENIRKLVREIPPDGNDHSVF